MNPSPTTISSMPRTSRRSPSGKQMRVHKEKKPSAAHCTLCKTKLAAIPRRSPSAMSKLSKTQKRPQRMYAGVLCATCLKQILKERVRMQAGKLTESDVDVRHLPYLTRVSPTKK